MTAFTGFPSRPDYVAIPRVFFSDVLPFIEDAGELLVTLQAFRLLSARRGYPRAVALSELMEDRSLATAFSRQGRDPAAEVARGLAAAIERGTLLRAAAPGGTIWVLLNTRQERRAAAAIARGEIALAPGAAAAAVAPVRLPQRDIFTLYEECIGVLSPIMAERLQDAEREYPPGWIEEAFRIAEENNQRYWRYVERILQRWKAEGKDDGKTGRHPKTPGSGADYSTWLPSSRRPKEPG